jgi:hypothetical protein
MVRHCLVRGPRREASVLALKPTGKVDVCLAVQEIAMFKLGHFSDAPCRLENTPIKHAVRVVVMDLALTLRLLRPLDRHSDPAVGAKLPACVFLPGQ